MKAQKAKKKATAARAPGKRQTRPTPTEEEIRLRAYEIYVRGGWKDGQDLDDWFQAESELIAEMRKQPLDS